MTSPLEVLLLRAGAVHHRLRGRSYGDVLSTRP